VAKQPGFFETILNGLTSGARTDAPSRRRQKPPTDPVDRYVSSHWGEEPDCIWDDPDFQGVLVEMGKLRELHVIPAKANGRPDFKAEPEILTFTRSDGAILAFTTDHAERLYISQPDPLKAKNRRLIDPSGEWHQLDDIARYAGGRQTRWGYPDIEAQALGYVSHVVYFTAKKGDGKSEYIHEFGEETKKITARKIGILAIDVDGRLWIAGGDYTVHDDGITN
jgi:hypothetical protein